MSEHRAAPQEGETPGARLTCMDCSTLYADFGLDTTLPDEQWRMIHSSDGGVLCAACIVKRATKLPGAVALRARIAFASDPAESGPRPEEEAARIREKYERVKEAYRDGALTVFNPEHNASWVDIATLLDQLQTLREENARLNRIIEITNRHVERILPCPDCRDKVKQGECERCARQRAEARAERAEQSLREKDAEIKEMGAELQRERAHSDELAERERTLREALDPLVDFIRKFDAKPLSNLGDEFYGIHTGTEWEASLRLSDLRKVAALSTPEDQ